MEKETLHQLEKDFEVRSDGVLYFKDRVWMPKVDQLRSTIMDKPHQTKYSIHPGADKIYKGLKEHYWWPGMKKDIALYVSKCMTCAKVKAKHQNPSGLLQQPEIPKWKWKQISMDFVTKLPKTKMGHDSIWVSPWKGLLRFGKKGKLGPRFVGPFEILERIGPVSYKLNLPVELSVIHDTFHVSNLKKCLSKETVVLPLKEVQINEQLCITEDPIDILDREVKKLRRSKLSIVKVRWSSKHGLEYTWEREPFMKSKYPHLFAKESPGSGKKVPFPIVQRALKSAWGKFGFNDVMMNNNGFFFIKFNDEGGSNQAVDEGMLMIRNIPLFVSPWDPSKGLSRPSHSSCPLWVKFHNVPLVLFNQEGISRIASAVGVPKKMDACTASMCDKQWGRPGFAKVLVEVFATGELKKELEVIIPHLKGSGVDTIKIGVEYVWEPIQCSHCCVFGHKKSSCAHVVRSNIDKKPVNVDTEGFTRVERKQWRRKEPTGSISSASGSGASSSGTKEDELSLTNRFDVMGKDQEDVQSPDSVVVTEEPNGVISGVQLNEPVIEPVIELSKEIPISSTTNATTASKDVSPNVEPDRGKKTPRIGVYAFCCTSCASRKPGTSICACCGSSEGTYQRGELDRIRQRLMFNIACWNIRGLNALEKQQEVRSFIRNNNVSVIAILESHVKGDALDGVCRSVFGRWGWVANHAYSEYGTRIILAWDVSVVDVMPLEFHRQFVHCEVKVRSTSISVFGSFIYGDNRGCNRRLLWSCVRKFKAIMGDKPWFVAGDFNCLLFPHDALGGASRRNRDMDDFASCLEDVDLFDIRFSGVHYTWCQKPKSESGLRRKLDRCLANTEFTDLLVDVAVRFLPHGLSDHSPGLISFKGADRIRKYGFKFDNFLVDDPSFRSTVGQVWKMEVDGTFMFRVTSKLKALKTPLRKLRSAYGNLTTTTVKLKEELDVVQLAADISPDDLLLQQEVGRIREAYQKSCWVDFSAARQRAKVQWLSDGDSNTRYFHRVIQERRHVNYLHTVSNGDGIYVSDEAIPKAFLDHFIAIIGSRDPLVRPEVSDLLFPNRLSVRDANHMIRPILDDDIRGAMFSIGNDKAPGSDGFSSKFFKATWDIVSSDVLLAIHNFFYRGNLSKEINHTLLCLLPKIQNASSVSDFRPIACCSVLYKCISKVIVERMKPYLDSLVSKAQSAFIPGRRIGDNILMAHELVTGYHLDRGPPRCAFKIDLRKAYDMVSWDYLFGMLEGFRFHPVLVKWIREMVSTVTFSVVVNGESHGFFPGKRGIRQGDPLSPYLFTLVMEGFSMIMKQCILEASSFGYHYGCQDLQLTHLCFADDLFVFTRGDVESVEILKKALDIFASKSGLAPNLQKSDAFFGNVAPDVRNAILNCLPFRPGVFPIRYLGVPLSPVSLRPSDFGHLVTKVKLRIQNWKSKFLSFGGRKQLIISVLQSLQLYWMAVFLIPSGVVHEIEKLCRDFLWAQGDSSKGKCKIAWNMVCRPVHCGGLGFRRLSLWNRALLARNIWAIITNRDCWWVSWVKTFAFRHAFFWTVKKTTRWSWVLSKIMSIRSDIRHLVTVRIGDGESTNAWEDNWLPCGHLASFIPYRLVHSTGFTADATVSNLVDDFHDSWPNDWCTRFPVLASTDLPVLTHGTPDVYCWDVMRNGHGRFSVRDAYVSFENVLPTVPWWQSVWFKGHIPKHSFCLWTACLNRLPTLDRVAVWKEEPPDLTCRLCLIASESHDHLFFECVYSRQVWLQVMGNLEWLDFSCSWSAIVAAMSDQDTRPKMLEHQLLLAATVYCVWCERNRRIFQELAKPVPHIVRLIMEAVYDRLAWKKRKKKPAITHVDQT
ncbi:hypothetical protein OSB04_028479 [Centaurea solstitialis]|uniref:Reverse transcriptase domain-containing protein n=1 Tax=Centaurea solstitialis TaxID=347529 RepID=A0AA38T0M8_9ASTR|nr:hypothetical protein OSB04_028479 [Centaurea solstitialis]